MPIMKDDKNMLFKTKVDAKKIRTMVDAQQESNICCNDGLKGFTPLVAYFLFYDELSSMHNSYSKLEGGIFFLVRE